MNLMVALMSPDTLTQKPLIGLMSGTSMDGVDGVLAYFKGNTVELLASTHINMPPTLRAECLALNQPGDNELHRSALASIALSELYADAVDHLLDHAKLNPSQVAAIGCHGQTVRHRPDQGYTVQLVNGAVLAERTGIPSIVDFRSRDIAAGGQGAPLVPAFHQAVLGSPTHARAVVNIGGFSNISVLRPDGAPIGFDCGPGNALMDAWIYLHQKHRFDAGGSWARSGQLNAALLEGLWAHPFFKRSPPRSTGRDDFHLNWLQDILIRTQTEHIPTEDVQGTLLELSAQAISQSIENFAPDLEEIFLCGGGAFNQTLVERLTQLLAPRPVKLTSSVGIREDQVEALAFAWLAGCTLLGQAGNLSSVTGAQGPRVLGALYPA